MSDRPYFVTFGTRKEYRRDSYYLPGLREFVWFPVGSFATLAEAVAHVEADSERVGWVAVADDWGRYDMLRSERNYLERCEWHKQEMLELAGSV
jgi:hypothetical protein